MKNDYIKPEVEALRLDLESMVCLSGNIQIEPEESGNIGGELPDGDKWD